MGRYGFTADKRGRTPNGTASLERILLGNRKQQIYSLAGGIYDEDKYHQIPAKRTILEVARRISGEVRVLPDGSDGASQRPSRVFSPTPEFVGMRGFLEGCIGASL